jgi:hypothetical protein
VFDQYLLHHHRDVSKESPFSSDGERGASRENNISLSGKRTISVAWVCCHARTPACFADTGGWANRRKMRSMYQGRFSFSVREQFAGEVWQTGSHEHRIRDSEDFRNQIEYVAENPQRRRLTDYRFVHTNYLQRLDGLLGELTPGRQ